MNNIELRIVTEYTTREELKAKMIKLREASYSNIEKKYNSFKEEDLQRRIDSQKEENTYAETFKSFNVSYIQSQNLDYINFLKLEDASITKITHRAIKIRDNRTDNIKKIYKTTISEKKDNSNEQSSIDVPPYQVYKNSDTNINFDKFNDFEDEEISKMTEKAMIEDRIIPQIVPERKVEESIKAEPINSIVEPETTFNVNEISQTENEISGSNSINDLKEMLARAQSLRNDVLVAKQERENAESSAIAVKEKLSDTTKKFESYCESLEEQRRKEEQETERLKTEAEQYQATINDMLEAMETA